MSTRCAVGPAVFWAMALCAAPILTAAPPGESGQVPASQGKADHRLATFDASTGETFFALSLSPPVVEPAASHDVVVLFDTSASQAGLYREDALVALRGLLDGLRATDRVRLIAVDVHAVRLTEGFVAPGSAEMADALAKLDRRIPLGSTDLALGIREAAQCLAAQPDGSRVVVYFGDGQSAARLMASDDLGQLVSELRDAKISVDSLAIGPRRDVAFLAALANHTGGKVIVDSDEVGATTVGAQLVAAVQAAVIWPTAAVVPPSFTELFPARFPPLRSDRDSVVVGMLADREQASIKVTAEVGRESIDMSWNLVPEGTHDDFVFLPELVRLARKDAGISLPTAGSDGLRAVAHVLVTNANEMTKLGAFALASGDTEGARRAAELALQQDESNPNAVALSRAISKYAVAQTTEGQQSGDGATQPPTDGPQGAPAAPQPPAGEAPLQLGKPAGDKPAGDKPAGDELLLETVDKAAGADMAQFSEQQRAQAQAVRQEVDQTLNEARKRMSTDAQSVTQDLKLLLDRIESSTILDADTRSQLTAKIRSSIREAGRLAYQLEEQRAQAEASEASARSAQRILDDTAMRDEQLKQLMARFNSLMAEGRFQDADEQIADEVNLQAPNNPISTSATWKARLHRQVEGMVEFHDKRSRNFADALYTVEESAIPFRDDPPIVYPSAERWQEITRKRAKYKSMSLTGDDVKEQTIAEELDKPTELDFDETELEEVARVISDQHGINIILDTKALTDAAIPTDTQITQHLHGIKLSSALRIMLSEHDLTYIIKDQVLKITTPEVAEQNMAFRVYYVGDLVVPITSGMGGMMGGGMMGGMGGMGGGMGGMGGGMGGMGGGMGGMGGGGGLFVVEDELQSGQAKSKPTVDETAKVAKPVTVKSATVEPATVKSATVKSATVKSATVKSATVKQAPQRIQLSRGASSNEQGRTHTADEWRKHFTAHSVEPADVRETVRQLMGERQPVEVIAVIQGAILAGYPQPWMYEALAMASYMANESPEEIERTLMSAVDFARDEDDLINVAKLMANMGLESSAIQVLEQASRISPQRPEPYLFGLELARRVNNQQAVAWACNGILSQAWPREQWHVPEKAYHVAKAMLAELAKDSANPAAKALEQQFNSALQRDCIVQVTWTGDADVDLLVQEPSGDICSLQNQRSRGGGLIVGDTYARAGKTPADGYSEVYVCPIAFSGEYRLLVRRVWGDVTAGKVTVDIVTNYGTPEQKISHQQIPIAEKDAMVLFEVPKGRRVEHLAQVQMANLDQKRQDLGRAVIGQQLNQLGLGSGSSSGSQAQSDLDRARRLAALTGRGPLWRRGAVGFIIQPTILPEGTMMFSQAVVSGDRRYVRVTPSPMFSAVGDVFTFNAISGQGGAGGGGGGGGFGGGFGGGGFQ